MKTITNAERPHYIINKEEFKTGSSNGVFEGKDYAVYSYDTLIYKVDKDGKIVYWDGGKYSRTTTLLQNQIKLAASTLRIRIG